VFRMRGIGTGVVELVAKCRPNKPLQLADPGSHAPGLRQGRANPARS
jgi:hypothetical protein